MQILRIENNNSFWAFATFLFALAVIYEVTGPGLSTVPEIPLETSIVQPDVTLDTTVSVQKVPDLFNLPKSVYETDEQLLPVFGDTVTIIK